MPVGVHKRVIRWSLAVLLAGGLLVVGRFSAGPRAGSPDAHPLDQRVGHDAAYLAGLQAGLTEGRAEGRALQEGDALPAASRQPVRDAFAAGYAAGANDVFAGYDGGWMLTQPYIITLANAQTSITYRISSRLQLMPDINYFLCADGRDLCQDIRH